MRNNTPNFSSLRAFESAARLGAFSRAAEELNITPSAISHQIKCLENYFGRKLFNRHAHGVATTEDGTRLLHDLSNALDIIDHACQRILPTLSVYTLSVHSSPSFAIKWLSSRMPLFLEQRPNIRFQLTTNAEPVDMLKHRDIDAQIVYATPPKHPQVETVPLGLEKVTPLFAPNQFTKTPLDSNNRVFQAKLIESELSPIKWEDWFEMAGIEHSPATYQPRFDRGALAVDAAIQGLGVALETTRFAHEEIANGRLVNPKIYSLPFIQQELHFLCYRKQDRNSPKIIAFKSWLLEEIQNCEKD